MGAIFTIVGKAELSKVQCASCYTDLSLFLIRTSGKEYISQSSWLDYQLLQNLREMIDFSQLQTDFLSYKLIITDHFSIERVHQQINGGSIKIWSLGKEYCENKQTTPATFFARSHSSLYRQWLTCDRRWFIAASGILLWRLCCIRTLHVSIALLHIVTPTPQTWVGP